MRFRNRLDAGRQLSAALAEYRGRPGVLVLGLPRGGVPVARAVADALEAPLDVLLVRKLGLPGHQELAMGAVAEGGVEVLNDDLIREVGIPQAVIQEAARREHLEIDRRALLYRGAQTAPVVRDRTVIVVDDGLATGSTMQAAVLALRAQSAAQIIVAVPVGSREACRDLSTMADRVVCLSVPDSFEAVGQWYDDFAQTTDEEVQALLSAEHDVP